MKKLFANLSLLAALLALSAVADAQVYTKFGPANGVLKGSTTTFQTTAATSTDITSLWSGTCDVTTFLRGGGACTLLAGGDIPPINLGTTANGGVSSASILLGTNGGTSNGFFSVTGPAAALRTFTFPNASATVLTTNALVTVPQGGIGVGTLTGLPKGNGTSAFTAATSADVVSLWTGTCTGTNVLQGNGVCGAGGGGGTPGGSTTQVQFNNAGAFAGSSDLTFTTANRTLNVGGITGAGIVTPVLNASGTGLALTIRGGSTSNASSSPGDLNISGGINSTDGPGGNIFMNAGNGTGPSGAAGGSVFINGGNGIVGFSGGPVSIGGGSGGTTNGTGGDVGINGGAGGNTGGSGGNASVVGGTPSAGNGGNVNVTAADGVGTNKNGGNVTITAGANTGSGTLGKISLLAGNGVVVGVPTGGAKGVGTVNATGLFVNGVAVGSATQTTGSFTMTLSSGCTTTPTSTAFYTKTGNAVTLRWTTTYSCTGNSTTVTLSGLPAAIQPATGQSGVSGIAADTGGNKFTFFSVCNSSSSGCTAGNMSLVNAAGAWAGSGSFVISTQNITYSLD